jgi:hypothetical protein
MVDVPHDNAAFFQKNRVLHQGSEQLMRIAVGRASRRGRVSDGNGGVLVFSYPLGG